MNQILFCALISVFAISLISLIGIFTLSLKSKKFLIVLIALSAGTLLGDAFIHLLPELIENNSFGTREALLILAGITGFFFLEKVIHWRHCHETLLDSGHVHTLAYTNLIGDAIHNFLDGIIIATSYLVSIPTGIATTIAVGLHEIPQEIGDFAVLIHAGFSKKKALYVNFISALAAILGAVLTFFIGSGIENLERILIPLAIGGFIYIAGTDLIPEIHKHSEKIPFSLMQILAFIIGILVMFSLTFLE